MRKYILISIILVCVFGCGNEGLEDKIKDLENENKDLGVKLQRQSTDLESSTGVVKDVTSLLKNIQEIEAKIEEKRHILRNTIEMENTVDLAEEILNSIQELYDELKRQREKAAKLQEKLDSFVTGDAHMNEIISSLKTALEEKTMKVEDLAKKNFSLKKHVTRLEIKQGELTNKIVHLKSELNIKEKEVSSKELVIKDLNEKLNNIFYIVGSSRDLIRNKIIVKKGIPLLRLLNPFSRNYVLGQDIVLAKFKKEKKLLTKFSIEGKIKKILPYRSKSNYDVTYKDGLSFINIKDSKNFWMQKYLIIVTW